MGWQASIDRGKRRGRSRSGSRNISAAIVVKGFILNLNVFDLTWLSVWMCLRLISLSDHQAILCCSTLEGASMFAGGRSGTCTAPRLCWRWASRACVVIFSHEMSDSVSSLCASIYCNEKVQCSIHKDVKVMISENFTPAVLWKSIFPLPYVFRN